MRTAALLAVLASELADHILQPTYILSSGAGDEFASFLSNLAVTDPERESYLRSVLLASVGAGDKGEMAGRRVKITAGNVFDVVAQIFSSCQQQPACDGGSKADDTPLRALGDKFQLALEKFCAEACELWQTVQQIEAKIELSFALDYEGDWLAMPLSTQKDSDIDAAAASPSVRDSPNALLEEDGKKNKGRKSNHSSSSPQKPKTKSSNKKGQTGSSGSNINNKSKGHSQPSTQAQGESATANNNLLPPPLSNACVPLADILAPLWPVFLVVSPSSSSSSPSRCNSPDDYLSAASDDNEDSIVNNNNNNMLLLKQGYVLVESSRSVQAAKAEERRQINLHSASHRRQQRQVQRLMSTGRSGRGRTLSMSLSRSSSVAGAGVCPPINGKKSENASGAGVGGTGKQKPDSFLSSTGDSGTGGNGAQQRQKEQQEGGGAMMMTGTGGDGGGA